MDLIINTDGASRGNPGPASYGYTIKERNGPILHQDGQAIGINTNNVAEYTAVLKALQYVKKYLAHKAPHMIHVICDSQLIAQQLLGNYKIKHPGLIPLFDSIKRLEPMLGIVTYENVPRAQNYIADKLANMALDRLSQ